MSFILQSELARRVSLNFALPTTSLFAGQTMVVGVFKLEAGQSFKLDWLSISVSDVRGSSSLTNQGMGLCYGGLYFGGATLAKPAGMPIIGVVAKSVGVSVVRPHYSRVLQAPGVYTLLAVNNTAAELSISAAASALVTLSS